MKRRAFIILLGGAAASYRSTARAQQPAMPVIGFLSSGAAAEWAQAVSAFRQGLSETGYVEGQNVVVEYRWAGGSYDRLPVLAADLVRRQVSVIVSGGGPPTLSAAIMATSAIPIVFTSGTDPVRAGAVASLNRPGGNVTGVSFVTSMLGPKRLELLHELIPKDIAITLLVNPNNPNAMPDIENLTEAALAKGLRVIVLQASTERTLDQAFATLVERQAGALLVDSDGFFFTRRDRLVALAESNGVPTMYFIRDFVTAGGLISYGPSLTDVFRQAGIYTGKILKGARPSDLPVMQPTKFELVINLKTAKALGLTVPPALLARADEVIE